MPILSVALSFFRFGFAGPYAILMRMALLSLVLLSVSRIGLTLWEFDRVIAAGSLWEILLQGIRADLIVICFWLLPPVVLAPLWASSRWLESWQQFTWLWSSAGLMLFIFMELATPGFILQYDVRPNRLFVEYLKYPKEVFSTLWHGFRVAFLLGIVLTLVLSWLCAQLLVDGIGRLSYWSPRKRWLTWPLIIIALVMGIRSTTGHRPVNPAFFAITGDALVNSMVISSTYSVLFAVYNMKHEARSSEIYGKLSTQTILKETLAWPWLKSYVFQDAKCPTLHWQQSVIQRDKPLNLVIVLEESLGATFVESLGGLPVTPELEKLKDQGWWFEQMYATGTRSVRGIEAVVAGFMPTPAQSTVKLSLSQKGFATLGSVLAAQGFHTEFMYGGEAHFDNMRSFFTGNGFTNIVDIHDLKDPAFIGSWGASDEDLFNHAHKHLQELHTRQIPFFSLIFSSSNHAPFEFPDDRIELYEQPKNTVNNAVKYADYALGKFIEQAKQSSYWQDTLFLIVADHDNRVYGNNLVPVEKFHIPALILGADIKPERITPIASQIDLAPTVLSLMGVSSQHPMVGRDFALDRTSPGRAMMQFEDYFALMENNQLTILRANQSPVLAKYELSQKHIHILPQQPLPEAHQRALAHVLLPSWLYRKRLYCQGTQGL